jgi:hypothetical protein
MQAAKTGLRLHFIGFQETIPVAGFGVDGSSTAAPDLANIYIQPMSTIRRLEHVVRRGYEIRGTSAYPGTENGASLVFFEPV